MLVISNGMIRSGSTLQFNICKQILEAKYGQIVSSFYPEDVSTDFFDSQKIKLLKSHILVPGALINDPIFKTVYIFRDLRSVALSLKRKLKCDISHCVVMIDNAINEYHKIVDRGNVHIQKYETIYDDLYGATKEIDAYLDTNLTLDVIKTISNNCRIEAIKNKTNNSKKGIVNNIKLLLDKWGIKRFNVYDRDTFIHHNHFSSDSGNPHTWKTQLSDKEINMIQDNFFLWLEKHEYEIF